MKTDLRRDPGGGSEEPLQSILRRWEAPLPPDDLEEDLRRAFRRRGVRRRGGRWLALAAALALLAVWPLLRRDTAPRIAPSLARVATPAPPAVVESRAPAEPSVISLAPRVASPRVAVPPRRASRAKAAVVIVEPGQAELLARLGEGLQRMRPSTTVFSGTPVTGVAAAPIAVVRVGAPETATLALRNPDVPRYTGEWERVSGVWPPVQLSAPIMGR